MLAIGRLDVARFVQKLMPDEQCDAQSPARIAGGGLNPDILERPVAENLAVADAVEGDTAGEAEVFHAGCLAHMAGDAEHDFFGHLLDRGGDVHFALGELGFGRSRRAAEEAVELPRGHGHSLAVIEIGHVHTERAVFLQVDQFHDLLDEGWLSVGGEAHKLVFAAVHFEAGEIGERGIEQAEGMGESELVSEIDFVSAAGAEAGGGPFADAVEG